MNATNMKARTTIFMRNALTILALLCATLAGPAQAEILVYFWHDADGMIHFSSQRPTEGQIYAVHMPSYTNSSPDLPAKPLTYEALFAATAEADKSATEKLLAERAIAELKKQCESARAKRETLINNVRVQVVDDQGIRRDMGYDEKMAEVTKLDKVITDTCKK